MWDGKKFIHQLPLKESYCYKSLVNKDRKVYDNYANLLKTTSEHHTCSYREFTELYEKIKLEGWNSKYSITLSWPYGITDGQHRSSILLSLNPNARVRKVGTKLFPLVDEELQEINGFRPEEIHTAIVWDGTNNKDKAEQFLKNIQHPLEVVSSDLIKLNKEQERRLTDSIYGKKAKSRVKGGSIYLIIIKDLNPTYLWEQATSCKQVLNTNMKYLKNEMRKNIGKGEQDYFSIHTSYNVEESLMVLKPLGLCHLVERKKFDSFKELFNLLNADKKLKYIIQRSFGQLANPPSTFGYDDVDILVNDYYYFKAITGARSNNISAMRENDNGYWVQSNILVDNVEIRFDIRFLGDNYINSRWEKDMLENRSLFSIGRGLRVFIPNIEDELCSMLYYVLIQKKNPLKSKHRQRIKELFMLNALNQSYADNESIMQHILNRFLKYKGYE